MHSTGLHGAKFVPQGVERGEVVGWGRRHFSYFNCAAAADAAGGAVATTGARHQFDLNA